ncbi:hypothetical protein Hanom_Chr06g00565081 [Helianthus anomalus]
MTHQLQRTHPYYRRHHPPNLQSAELQLLEISTASKKCSGRTLAAAVADALIRAQTPLLDGWLQPRET